MNQILSYPQIELARCDWSGRECLNAASVWGWVGNRIVARCALHTDGLDLENMVVATLHFKARKVSA